MPNKVRASQNNLSGPSLLLHNEIHDQIHRQQERAGLEGTVIVYFSAVIPGMARRGTRQIQVRKSSVCKRMA